MAWEKDTTREDRNPGLDNSLSQCALKTSAAATHQLGACLGLHPEQVPGNLTDLAPHPGRHREAPGQDVGINQQTELACPKKHLAHFPPNFLQRLSPIKETEERQGSGVWGCCGISEQAWDTGRIQRTVQDSAREQKGYRGVQSSRVRCKQDEWRGASSSQTSQNTLLLPSN